MRSSARSPRCASSTTRRRATRPTRAATTGSSTTSSTWTPDGAITARRGSSCRRSIRPSCIAGVLFAQSYFDRNTADEKEIRRLADEIYQRVDWRWFGDGNPLLEGGWTPEHEFDYNYYRGYNEALILYIVALGSPTHGLGPGSWKRWTETYDRTWGEFQGQTHLGGGPLFWHQYAQSWIDFRGIQDSYMRAQGHRLLHEQPARDAVAARVRDPQSDAVEGLRRGHLGTHREQRPARAYTARRTGPLRERSEDASTAISHAASASATTSTTARSRRRPRYRRSRSCPRS